MAPTAIALSENKLMAELLNSGRSAVCSFTGWSAGLGFGCTV